MKKVVLFISICYIISIIIGVLIWNIPKAQDPTSLFQLFLKLVLMISPAVVAFLVEKEKFSRTLYNFQLNFQKIKWKKSIKYLLFTCCLLPVLFILYGYLLGNILEIKPFGKIVTHYTQLSSEIVRKMPTILKTSYFLPILLVITFISGLLAAISINGFFALGEEIGWRGFLEKNIDLPFFRKNILIGTIWGIWHAPIILCGHNYPAHPYSGIFMMVLFCIVTSFYFSSALKNTQSLFVIGALHGGINAIVQTLVLIQIQYNDLFGPAGFLMVLSILTVFFISLIVIK